MKAVNSTFIVLVLTLLPNIALTNEPKVYKTVNPDGSVSYSDTASNQAKEYKINPITTVPAFAHDIKSQSSTPQATSYKTEAKQSPQYQKLEFVNPVNGSAFHSASGDVDVQLVIEPALKPGDTVLLKLDGKSFEAQLGLDWQLKNVFRGTHTLEASIINAKGKTQLSTQISFTIHRPSIKR